MRGRKEVVVLGSGVLQGEIFGIRDRYILGSVRGSWYADFVFFCFFVDGNSHPIIGGAVMHMKSTRSMTRYDMIDVLDRKLGVQETYVVFHLTSYLACN